MKVLEEINFSMGKWQVYSYYYEMASPLRNPKSTGLIPFCVCCSELVWIILCFIDVTRQDSGNYTCEIRGPRWTLLGLVTHQVFVKGYLCMFKSWHIFQTPSKIIILMNPPLKKPMQCSLRIQHFTSIGRAHQRKSWGDKRHFPQTLAE